MNNLRSALARIVLPLIGMISGLALWLDQASGGGRSVSVSHELAPLIFAAATGAIVLVLFRRYVRGAVSSYFPRIDHEAYEARDALAYLPFLIPVLGGAGVMFPPSAYVLAALAFCAIQAVLIGRSAPERSAVRGLSSPFFISGGAALVYQIVWYRVLFASYGINIESVTVIVSVFMFGLGLGSLMGGRLSKAFPDRLPELFLIFELSICAFGVSSVPLITHAADAASGASLWTVGASVFGLLAIPTMLMGATLPVLVTYINRSYDNAGRSVGMLYFINTMGSAAFSFITVDVLFALTADRARRSSRLR